MSESKRGSLPMVQGTSLSKTWGASTPEEVERMRNVPYASAIGSIMYVMVCTRPDVIFTLSVTSRYQSNPGKSHWTVVKNILSTSVGLRMPSCGAIAQAKEPRSHQKTKHIVRRYHIIREIIARGDVEICKIGTDDNIADPLTRAMGKPKHESHTWSMGIREMLDWP
ncbi:unnamed protein product [Cuscuta campestris]|uniref:Retrovirus-related Pol polyprotein from transposon TNT 1-94 n=1 Tax=Cuscuta campestris TaxID=132261 RepID=A0A484KL51_9ASTE|nr:unnamed protein product [Cuscuta campestris]